MYIYSLVPLALGLLVVLVGVCRAFFFVPVTRRTAIYSQHCWALLLLSYLVLPPTSTKQLQALQCFEISHDGSRHLRQDSQIDCDSAAHRAFELVDAFLIALSC